MLWFNFSCNWPSGGPGEEYFVSISSMYFPRYLSLEKDMALCFKNKQKIPFTKDWLKFAERFWKSYQFMAPAIEIDEMEIFKVYVYFFIAYL